MKWRTVLALIGISLLTQGCQLAWDATTNVVFETCLFTDTMTSRVHYCLQANEAWKEYLSHHGDGDYCPDFAKGFKAGYKDFLYGGGDTAAPPAPPMKYWKLRFQNQEGREASKMWSLGYAEGAMAAKASGARNFIMVPFNKIAPPGPGGVPPGPAMGAAGTPPGMPILPPQMPPPGTEIELPAPRPTPGKVVPPQANKTSSTKPGTSPVPQKTTGSGTSQAGQQPDLALETVPAQPIRSLLGNEHKAPASNPKSAPSTPLLGTPGVKPGKAVPPRKSPALSPQLPPPVPDMQFLPPPSAPTKVVPSQNNKTSSAKPGVPPVSQKAVTPVSDRLKQQPAKLADGVPMQPIRSLISSETRPTSEVHSESMPVQSIRSLLSGNEPSLNP